jgi:hypothetical protein
MIILLIPLEFLRLAGPKGYFPDAYLIKAGNYKKSRTLNKKHITNDDMNL